MNILNIIIYKSQQCIRYFLFRNYRKIIYLADIMHFKKMSKILHQLCISILYYVYVQYLLHLVEHKIFPLLILKISSKFLSLTLLY